MNRDRHAKIILVLGILVLVTACAVSVCIGSYPLNLSDIIKIITGNCDSTIKNDVFIKLRLPRTLMAAMAGMILGTSGGVFQILFKNKLASPDILGISAGATGGAALMIVLGVSSISSLVAGAFAGSLIALAVVFILVRIAGTYKTSTYILAGIIVSALAKAFIMILKVMADSENQIAAIEFWTMGSLSAVTWHKIPIVAVCIIISVFIIYLMRREIMLLSLTEDNAAYMGLNVRRAQIIILTASVLGVASVTSQIGIIAFLGLLSPHIAYLLIHKKSGGYLALSGICGSVITVVADIITRIFNSYGELPVSIVTTIVAAPVLIWLLAGKEHEEHD